LGLALATQYYATPTGANVSELSAHGGIDLGLDTVGEAGASPRTSLAYVPVGSGGILFFGGADYSGYNGYVPFAQGWITDGTAVISLDIALWLDLDSAPLAGGSNATVVSVPAGGEVDIHLAVPATSSGLEWVAVDRSDSVLLAGESGTL
jgi:hypothetical protein